MLPPPEAESDDWGDDFSFSPNGALKGGAQKPKLKLELAKKEPPKPAKKEEEDGEWGDDFDFGSKDDPVAPLKGLLNNASLADDSFGDDDDLEVALEKLNGNKNAVKPVVPDKTLGNKPTEGGIGKWGEANDQDDDWNDVGDLASRLQKQLKKDATIKHSASHALSVSSDASEDDIFDEFEEELDDDFDFDTNFVKDNLTKMSEQILKLMARLQPDQDEEVILSTTHELVCVSSKNALLTFFNIDYNF